MRPKWTRLFLPYEKKGKPMWLKTDEQALQADWQAVSDALRTVANNQQKAKENE